MLASKRQVLVGYHAKKSVKNGVKKGNKVPKTQEDFIRELSHMADSMMPQVS